MADRVNTLIEFLKANPKDCFLNHAIALEYVKQGEEEKARASFEFNLMNDPDYVATYYHLAKLLERIGLPEQAINIYEQGMVTAKKTGDMHTYSELQSAYEDIVY